MLMLCLSALRVGVCPRVLAVILSGRAAIICCRERVSSIIFSICSGRLRTHCPCLYLFRVRIYCSGGAMMVVGILVIFSVRGVILSLVRSSFIIHGMELLFLPWFVFNVVMQSCLLMYPNSSIFQSVIQFVPAGS